MSSTGKGSEGSAIAKAAGAAVITGIGWSVMKSLSNKKDSVHKRQQNQEPVVHKQQQEVVPIIEVPEGIGEDGDEVIIAEEVIIMEKRQPMPPTEEVYSQKDDAHKWAESRSTRNGNIFEKTFSFFANSKNKGSPPKSSALVTAFDYQIQKGDTLWAISRKYGITLQSLKAANGLSGDDIYAGDKLVIPEGNPGF